MGWEKIPEPLEVDDGDDMASVEETLSEGSADIATATGEKDFHGKVG
jgi:hypothetical protein